jgi:hypothetical protein
MREKGEGKRKKGKEEMLRDPKALFFHLASFSLFPPSIFLKYLEDKDNEEFHASDDVHQQGE